MPKYDGYKFKDGESRVSYIMSKSSRNNAHARKYVRCCYCGTILCTRKGNVEVIIETEVVELDDPIEILCKGCNTLVYIS